MATIPTSESCRWLRCPETALFWVRYDDEFVVYHRPSGKTHFLNAAAHLLITEILARPSNIDEIIDRFVSRLDEPDRTRVQKEMIATLRHLNALGLVESV